MQRYVWFEWKPDPDLAALIDGTALALGPVSYTHLRAHETVLDLVCRLLLEKKKTYEPTLTSKYTTMKLTNVTRHAHNAHVSEHSETDLYVTES